MTPEQQARAAAEEAAEEIASYLRLGLQIYIKDEDVEVFLDAITRHCAPAPSLATAIERVKALRHEAAKGAPL